METVSSKDIGNSMYRTAAENVVTQPQNNFCSEYQKDYWDQKADGDDVRLSDARDPLAHAHAKSDISGTGQWTAAEIPSLDASKINAGTFNIARIPTGSSSSTVCLGNDSRLSDARTPLTHVHAQSDVTGLASALSSKADLVGGVVPTAQIPAIAISEFLGDVSTEAAMLLLTGQRGDWCIRTDVGLTFFLITDDPTNILNWKALPTVSAPVISVNTQTGVVVLGKADVGLGNVDNTSDASKPISSATQTALNAKEASLPSKTGNALKYLRVNVLETGFEYATPAGGGGGGNFGTATIDFGAFPGTHEASVSVTGQSSITSTSKVQAWLFPTTTSDHTADEHVAEFINIKIICSDLVDGTGFTIRAFYDGMQEPLSFPGGGRLHKAHATTGNNYLNQPTIVGSVGGMAPRIYGQWSLQWSWG